MEQNDINEQVKRHADIRFDNFSNNESKFIDSSLERTRRTIVIDRVFKSNPSSSPILLTHPDDIKKEVVNHFQNFVNTPSHPFIPLDQLPDLWKQTYSPLPTVDNFIYTNLMAPPSLEEWTDVINALPKEKAPGPSQITNEMLQHLGSESMTHLYNLVCLLKTVKFLQRSEERRVGKEVRSGLSTCLRR